MRIKIFFTPWTRYWNPEDIEGFDDDGKEILRPGAKPHTHSGWSCGYRIDYKLNQYGRYVIWNEPKDGFFPPSLRGTYFYREMPRFLYQDAKDFLKKLQLEEASKKL